MRLRRYPDNASTTADVVAAEAVEATSVIAFRRSRLVELTADDPAFGEQVMVSMMRSLERAQDHMLLLGRKNAMEKVAAFLLEMDRRLAGAGMLALTSAESTFTTGVSLAAGSLMLGANSTGSGPVTKGPLGVGTLLVGAGTTLLSDGTARSVANAVTVGGDFTFGGLTAGNGVTLSGAIDLGASGRTITVTSPAVTSTLSGPLTSTATGTALTKAGPGVLVLSGTTSNLGGAGITVANKVYDNTTSSTVNSSTPTLTGLVSGDVLTVSATGSPR